LQRQLGEVVFALAHRLRLFLELGQLDFVGFSKLTLFRLGKNIQYFFIAGVERLDVGLVLRELVEDLAINANSRLELGFEI